MCLSYVWNGGRQIRTVRNIFTGLLKDHQHITDDTVEPRVSELAGGQSFGSADKRILGVINIIVLGGGAHSWCGNAECGYLKFYRIFTTFLCEVESIIYSRPLTKVSDDSLDDAAVTPADLLRER